MTATLSAPQRESRGAWLSVPPPVDTGGGGGEFVGYPNVVVIRSTGGDQTEEIQAALDVSGGQLIYLPDSQYSVSAELVMVRPNTRLLGRGFGRKGQDGLPVEGSTSIVRSGSGGGAVIRVSSDAASDAAELNQGYGYEISNLNIRADGADIGLHVLWTRSMTIRRVNIINAAQHQMLMEPITVPGYNWSAGLQAHQLELTAQGSSNGLTILGGHTMDFYALDIWAASGTGLYIRDVDDIAFYSARIYSATAPAWNFDIGRCYNVHFFTGYPMLDYYGTPVGGRGIVRADAVSVTFDALSTIDRMSDITIEPGAIVHFTDDLGRNTYMPDARSSAHIKDDFVAGAGTSGAIGELGWLMVSGACVYSGSTANHFGIHNLSTGATANSTAAIQLSAHLVPSENWKATFIFSTSHVDGNTIARVGLVIGGTATQPTNGIYFERLAGENNWFAVCRSGGVQTRVAIEAATTAFIRGEIRRVSATKIGFSIGVHNNGAEDVQISTNVPTAQLIPMYMVRNVTAVDRVMGIDYFQFYETGMNRDYG